MKRGWKINDPLTERFDKSLNDAVIVRSSTLLLIAGPQICHKILPAQLPLYLLKKLHAKRPFQQFVNKIGNVSGLDRIEHREGNTYLRCKILAVGKEGLTELIRKRYCD